MVDFNLVEQPWITLESGERVGLLDIFSRWGLTTLAGNPIQKLALFKLFLAIGQAALTPKTELEWAKTKPTVFSDACVSYLKDNKDLFYLYGEKPFLQFRALSAAGAIPINALLPNIAVGNTTVVFNSQIARPMDDAQAAILLVCQMGFALSGKKPDNGFSLQNGYTAKTASGIAGSSLGANSNCFLHSFWMNLNCLLSSIWLNIYSEQGLDQYLGYAAGDLGTAPWERMPTGEDCAVAQRLKKTYMGRLVPMGRFCLLNQPLIHITEGVRIPGYSAGAFDPSVTINLSKSNKPSLIWANSEMKPWHQLPSLLSFLKSDTRGFECRQLKMGISRFNNIQSDLVGLWCSGTSLSSNAGEQYFSGNDDFVDSLMIMNKSALGESWYTRLIHFFDLLDKTKSRVYGAVKGYMIGLGCNDKKDSVAADHASVSTAEFWLAIERLFGEMIHVCDNYGVESPEAIALKKKIGVIALSVYDKLCPRSTARQIESWASSRPNLGTLFEKTSAAKKEAA